MGAFLSAIGGAGQAAAPVGQQVRSEKFQHQQNELNRWQMQHTDLANLTERIASQYDDGPEKLRLLTLAGEIHSLPAGTPLHPYWPKLDQARQAAERAKAEAAMAGARTGQTPTGQAPAGQASVRTTIPGVIGSGIWNGGPGGSPPPVFSMGGPAPTSPVTPPFAPMIAQSAAQPAGSPVQGGGSSSPATFQQSISPTPAGTNTGGNAGPQTSQPVPPPVASPLADIQSIIGPALENYKKTGLRTKLIDELLPEQLKLGVGGQKLALIDPYLKDLDPKLANLMRAEVLMGGNASMTPLVSTMFAAPTRIQLDASTMTPADKAEWGLKPDDTGKYTGLLDRFGGKRIAGPGWAGARIVTDENGDQHLIDINEGLGGVVGKAPSQVTPKTITLPNGQTALQTPAGAAAGKAPVALGGINPSMQQRSTTTSTPGAPPTTRTTVVGRGTSGGGTGGAGALTGVTGKPVGYEATAKRYADDYLAGKLKFTEIPPVYRNLVQQRLDSTGAETPETLTAKGQSDLASLDPVLKQIRDLKQMLEEKGLANDTSYKLAPEFLKYSKLGRSTPYDSLFTGMSFEQLRSAAAALKGLNSRAYPILQRALQHTPTLDRAHGFIPDTPKLMYDKLNTMEGILEDGRRDILRDERKSGVIAPMPGTGKVKLQAPTGQVREVDASEVDHYLKQGAKRVQ